VASNEAHGLYSSAPTVPFHPLEYLASVADEPETLRAVASHWRVRHGENRVHRHDTGRLVHDQVLDLVVDIKYLI